MKRIALYIGFFFLLIPQVSLAKDSICSSAGFTIVFVNGIFSDLEKAKYEKDQLKYKFGDSFKGEIVNFRLGYNPSHLAGAGDLAQSLAQQFSYSVSDYDLHTILMQIHPEVTTRKLLIVGHSQGAYYAGEMYDYLLGHGEPKSAINVYEVASPAPKITAGARYLNSSTDLLLTYLQNTLHFKLLSPNIDIELQPEDTAQIWPGHSFLRSYLAGASDRIVSDISEQLSALEGGQTTQGDCFTVPESTIGYKTQRAIFAIADPSATALRFGAETTAYGVYALGKGALFLARGAVDFLTDTIVVTASPRDQKADDKKTFEIIKKLYGSSLTSEEYDELTKSQGGAVALAVPREEPIPVNGGFVEGTSTGPVALPETPTSTPPFIPAPSTPTQGGVSGGTQTVEISEPDTVAVPEEPVPPTPQAPVPPQLAINEVQWAGDRVNSNREWVEIKNLSDSQIDLSDIVLFASEGGSQYVPLSGSIPAKGFFVVERVENASLEAQFAQISDFEPLSDSGEQLSLVQVGEWGTTTIDQTPPLSACDGWCAGANMETSPVSGTLSMERVDALASGLVPSNWASNDTYTVSANIPGGLLGEPLYASILKENSDHWPLVGFFCQGDAAFLVPSNSPALYTPAGSECTYLSGYMNFIPSGHNGFAGLYQGVVGSSTAVTTSSYLANAHSANASIDFSVLTPGEYFVALFHSNSNPGYSYNNFYVQEMLSYLLTGLQKNGSSEVPPLDLKIIPFIYQP